MRRNWTPEEVVYLEEKWGVTSVKTIAKSLNRSMVSVKQKAQYMGLGDPVLHFDGISLSQLSVVLDVHYGILKRWVKDYDLPVKQKLFVESRKVLVIQYDDFWKWSEQHKHLLNFARLEPLTLGPEPDWVKEKRQADIKSHNKVRKTPWTKEEDLLLKSMVNAHRYTYPEISDRLQRSEAAIKRRLYDLNIKARPVRLNNQIKYTEMEVKLLVDMYQKGYGLNTIADQLNKSALGIRGKLERLGYKFKDGIPITKER